MGREVRMVPPNWEHPKQDRETNAYANPEHLQSMHDQHYDDAKREWLEGLAQWEKKEHKSQHGEYAQSEDTEWWEYAGNPPERHMYRPWKDEDATWFQMWQNVSEGTPVTPPFETKEGLINHLATVGEGYGECEGDGPWSRKAAEKFVEQGYAMSMIVANGKVFTAKDEGMYDLGKEK